VFRAYRTYGGVRQKHDSLEVDLRPLPWQERRDRLLPLPTSTVTMQDSHCLTSRNSPLGNSGSGLVDLAEGINGRAPRCLRHKPVVGRST
jgi:hypothetical protein